jgi:hypothetical protein
MAKKKTTKRKTTKRKTTKKQKAYRSRGIMVYQDDTKPTYTAHIFYKGKKIKLSGVKKRRR